MSEQFQLEEQYVISDLETLKVLSDPLRLRILEAMCTGPTTVKHIAEQIGVSPKKLYYHVNLLEEHGLIVVVDTRLVSGIVEKWYHVRACSYTVDKSLLMLTDEDGREFGNLEMALTSLFDAVRSDILQSAREGLIKPLEEDAQRRTLYLERSVSALRPGQRQVLIERLQALLDEFRLDELSEDEDDFELYNFTIMIYPVSKSRVSPDDYPVEDKDDG